VTLFFFFFFFSRRDWEQTKKTKNEKQIFFYKTKSHVFIAPNPPSSRAGPRLIAGSGIHRDPATCASQPGSACSVDAEDTATPTLSTSTTPQTWTASLKGFQGAADNDYREIPVSFFKCGSASATGDAGDSCQVNVTAGSFCYTAIDSTPPRPTTPLSVFSRADSSTFGLNPDDSKFIYATIGYPLKAFPAEVRATIHSTAVDGDTVRARDAVRFFFFFFFFFFFHFFSFFFHFFKFVISTVYGRRRCVKPRGHVRERRELMRGRRRKRAGRDLFRRQDLPGQDDGHRGLPKRPLRVYWAVGDVQQGDAAVVRALDQGLFRDPERRDAARVPVADADTGA
jgi:hypothetical protein